MWSHAPLVALLFLGAAAAQPCRIETYREAIAISHRGDWKKTEAFVDAALRNAGGVECEASLGLRVMRGTALYALNRKAEAVAVLSQPLPPAFRETEVEVRRLVYLGLSVDHGTAYEEQALQLAERKHPALVPEALNGMAAALVGENDTRRSTEFARRAAVAARNVHDSYFQIVAMITVARDSIANERYGEGIRLCEEAARLARNANYPNLAQKAEGNLGWALSGIGDRESAERLFVDAEAMAARLGAERDRITWANQVANIAFYRRDYERAKRVWLALYPRAKASKHWEAGAIASNLASVAIAQRNFNEARRFNQEAIAFKSVAKDSEGLLRSRILNAQIDLRSGDTDSAEGALKDVATRSERAAVKWEAEAQLAELYLATKRNALAEAQFRNAIATARAARTSFGADTGLRLSFYGLVDTIFDDYIDFLIASRRADDALQVTELIRAQSLEEAGGVRERKRADPRAIAKQQNATVLAYWVGGKHSYLWSITPNAVTLHTLPAEGELEAEVDRYGRELTSARGTLALSGARGERLYRMLVDPAARDVTRGGRVIVIADGRLQTLNFETLVEPGARRYWIEDAVIVSASSLELLARERTMTRNQMPSMLIVGNPPQADPAFPPLRHAASELTNVANAFRGTHLLVIDGPRATPAAYLGSSPGNYDFVHFVAHGDASRLRPLDSAVILANGAGGYRLTARDIITVPLHARLVTISSCNSAGARTYVGEGLVGLSWAFLRAGADDVIGALWDVSDEATPELMRRMYAGIRAGLEPPDALRQAKLALLHAPNAFQKPLYWAPFVLYT